MRSDARAKCVEISVINNNYCKLFTHLLGVLISTTKYKTRLSHRPQSSSTKCPALKSMVITNLKEKQKKYETETGCQLRRFVHVIWRQVAGSRSSRRRSRSNEFTSNSTSIRLPRSLSLFLSLLSQSLHIALSIYQLTGKWFALPLRSLNGFPKPRPKYTVIFSLITLFCCEDKKYGLGGEEGNVGQLCHTPHREGPKPLQINFVTFSFPQQNDQFSCHCA